MIKFTSMRSPIAHSVLLTLICLSSLVADDGEDRSPQIQITQPGVEFSLVAEHPDIASPIGVDVDQQGRVWVISSHTHHRPEDYEGPELDEVLVFDPDGTRHVFYNATHYTMDIELGPDGWVYLAERGRILRIKDTTDDGKADVEETLFTLTTEAVYPHNGLSGLTWHPGGDLLFGLGENRGKSWVLTGPDKTTLRGIGEGGIFRCRPDHTGVRQMARGLWNPFGQCVRSDGEIFSVDNDPGERPPCRLLHIVENGDYGYQRIYGHESHHPFVGWKGELRGTLPMIHPSGEAPCGVSPLGRGLIVPSWSDHRIQFISLTQEGASYSGQHIELLHGGRYFRPTCIAHAPSLSTEKTQVWYLTDWVDGRYEIQGFGRLWKLEVDLEQADWVGPTELEPLTQASLLAASLRQGRDPVSRQQLLKLANGDDAFIAQAALVALARKAPQWKVAEIGKLSEADRVSSLLALKMAADPGYAIVKNPLPSKPWVQAFLADSSPEVRFEILRWICDAQLDDYLPGVEKLLSENDLPFELFEAGIATWNTLNGQPEKGLRNPEMLIQRVKDPKSSPKLRAFALRMLPVTPHSATEDQTDVKTRFPSGLTLELIQTLLAVGDPDLSLEAVRVLAGNLTIGAATLRKVANDTTQTVTVRAEAITGLSGVAASSIDGLLGFVGGDDSSLREEALRSLRGVTLTKSHRAELQEAKSSYPQSADLIEALLSPETINQNRPAPEQTAAWLSLLDTVPGSADVEAGRRIFQHPSISMCSHCHRHGGRGHVVGPDLSAVGLQSDRLQLLESLLQPSREMAPEFQPSAILLVDGRIFTGIRLRSWKTETIRDNHGQNRSFDRADVEEISDLEKSFMPDGLADQMTTRELRDLIAFLSSSGTASPKKSASSKTALPRTSLPKTAEESNEN